MLEASCAPAINISGTSNFLSLLGKIVFLIFFLYSSSKSLLELFGPLTASRLSFSYRATPSPFVYIALVQNLRPESFSSVSTLGKNSLALSKLRPRGNILFSGETMRGRDFLRNPCLQTFPSWGRVQANIRDGVQFPSSPCAGVVKPVRFTPRSLYTDGRKLVIWKRSVGIR